MSASPLENINMTQYKQQQQQQQKTCKLKQRY